MNSILFATDGSKSSEEAVGMVKNYLEAWPETELYVLYVTVKDTYPYGIMTDAIDKYENEVTSDIKQNLEKQLGDDWNKRVQFIHETGHAGKTICKVADEKNVDLIMVGSHGRGLIDRTLIGSVARSVLNRTNRSVLVVR